MPSLSIERRRPRMATLLTDLQWTNTTLESRQAQQIWTKGESMLTVDANWDGYLLQKGENISHEDALAILLGMKNLAQLTELNVYVQENVFSESAVHEAFYTKLADNSAVYTFQKQTKTGTQEAEKPTKKQPLLFQIMMVIMAGTMIVTMFNT